MSSLKLAEAEARFADIIWDQEPLTSRRLTELAEGELGWKKSTTYTVLKRLCDRGLFQNQGGMVTSLMTKAEFCARRSEHFVEETFDGSLPAFLAAFSSRKKLSQEEIAQLEQIIQSMRG